MHTDDLHCRILVCCHKINPIPTVHTPYLPIQVGKELSTAELPMQGDNTGDNISRKNASYCELTGLYWAWKNLKDIDVIGLCHYRRFFDFHKQSLKSLPCTNVHPKNSNEINLSIPESIIRYVKDGGIIVPRCNNYEYSLFVDYCQCHISEDIKTLENIVKSTTAPRYTEAFDKVIHRGHKLIPFNMFIISWKEFDKYCNWIFPILENCEKHINTTFYKTYQKRVFGYMSERLLNVYIEAEKLKTKKIPVLYFDENEPSYTPSSWRYKWDCIKHNIAFSLICK